MAADVFHDEGKAGRALDPAVVLPGPVDVLVVCNGGCRIWVSPGTVGETCLRHTIPLRLPDAVDELIAASEAERGEAA